MAIGSILLKPQKLKRSVKVQLSASVLDDFLSLITLLMADASNEGLICQIIADAFESSSAKLLVEKSGSFSAASSRFAQWTDPISQKLQTFVEMTADLSSPENVLDTAEQLLSQLAGVANNLSVTQVREHVTEFLDIVQNDMGLTSTFIENQVWTLLDDIVLRLQQAQPKETPEMAANRREVAALIRRLKRHIANVFSFPSFNADQMTEALLRFLKRIGYDTATQKASCVSSRLVDAFEEGNTLAELVSNPIAGVSFGNLSVGAGSTISRPGSCPDAVHVEPEHPGTCPNITRDTREKEKTTETGQLFHEETPGQCYLHYNFGIHEGKAKKTNGLKSIAKLLKSNSDCEVHLTGYTDCPGTPELNRELRKKRVESVRDFFLNESQIDSARVHIEEAPLDEYIEPNSTLGGRSKNRSVTIKVVCSPSPESQLEPTELSQPTEEPEPSPDGKPPAKTTGCDYCWYPTWLLEYEDYDGVTFAIDPGLENELNKAGISEDLRAALTEPGNLALSKGAIVKVLERGGKWEITDQRKFLIKKEGDKLKISRKPLFEIDEDLESHLNNSTISNELRKEFSGHRGFPGVLWPFADKEFLISLTATISVVEHEKAWLIRDPDHAQTYSVKKIEGDLNVYPDDSFGVLFDLVAADFQNDLDNETYSVSLRRLLQEQGIPLSLGANITVKEAGNEWELDDVCHVFDVEKEDGKLNLYTYVRWGWLWRQLNWPPGDKVWVNKERTKVRLGNHRVLHTGTNVEWHDAPIFKEQSGKHYTFKYVSPDKMEHIARHSAYGNDGLNILLHVLSLERGDYASNSVNAAWHLANGLVKFFMKRPLYDVMGYPGTWGISVGGTILASLEGMHTRVSPRNWFAFWVFVLLSSDLGEKSLYSYWLNLARNFTLSFLTLLNHEEPESDDENTDNNKPRNREEIDGVLAFVVDIFLMIHAAIIPKDHYTYPFNTDAIGMTVGWWAAGSLISGYLSGVVGTLIAQSISRSFNAKEIFWSGATIKAVVWSLVRFWPYAYLINEGDTDQGEYNPTGPDFLGYPDPSNSPYFLPYTAGESAIWGQCNQGMWSHHNAGANLSQDYAFDIALDQGDPVLASRPGTLVDFFDWIPDDIEPNQNQQIQAAVAAWNSGLVVPNQTGFPNQINTPAGGPWMVTNIPVAVGTMVAAGATVATVQAAGGAPVPLQAFNAGQVVQINAVPGAVVAAGTPLVLIAIAATAWNFVMIRHDVDNTNAPLVDAAGIPRQNIIHDRGPGPGVNLVWTYGVYGHGRQNSVRNLFGGINPIGNFIVRARQIMLAGDTGVSFHNHLHMHVLTGPGPATAPPISRNYNGALGTQTIPFVFQEIDGDGVPTVLNSYISRNS